mgnify:CR=1 FL=1
MRMSTHLLHASILYDTRVEPYNICKQRQSVTFNMKLTWLVWRIRISIPWEVVLPGSYMSAGDISIIYLDIKKCLSLKQNTIN